MATPHQPVAGVDHEVSMPVASTRVMKEGMAKKRSGRMHQWTNRHFTLTDSGLFYKMKPDSTTVRGKFDFVPGSKVTDITEESFVKMKSNKLFSFWIVNPGTQKDKAASAEDKMDESDEENDEAEANRTVTNTNTASNTHSTSTSALLGNESPVPNRNLQHIVRNELNTQKKQKVMADEQVGAHQAHDNNVAQGALVAAVAVGGVVVGAMTMVSCRLYYY